MTVGDLLNILGELPLTTPVVICNTKVEGEPYYDDVDAKVKLLCETTGCNRWLLLSEPYEHRNRTPVIVNRTPVLVIEEKD